MNSSRRSFLKFLGLGAGAAAVTATCPPGDPAAEMKQAAITGPEHCPVCGDPLRRHLIVGLSPAVPLLKCGTCGRTFTPYDYEQLRPRISQQALDEVLEEAWEPARVPYREESLDDIICDIAPGETPFMSMKRRGVISTFSGEFGEASLIGARTEEVQRFQAARYSKLVDRARSLKRRKGLKS